MVALDSQLERRVPLGISRQALSTRRRVSAPGPGGFSQSRLAGGRSRSGHQLLPFIVQIKVGTWHGNF